MKTRLVEKFLTGGLVLQPEAFVDERGFFMEVFKKDELESLGIPADFVQENHSSSKKGTVRGLHFQYAPEMAKLMRVIAGEAFLVVVDIRKGSPTLKKWFGIEASAKNKLQIWAPAGCATGFCVTSECAEVQYLCTAQYNNKGESGVLWNDPAIGIKWPVKTPILSEKDKTAQKLAEWLKRPEADVFTF
jgi:dTDP-4-dehydrorhamnose 3,5-epimerase